MPITRTPIVDDDGSGTTGTVLDNAWKQELYNQIDALVNPVTPLIGAFTLVDASGAGLGNIGSGSYWKVGKAVLIVSSFLFPGTANGANNLLTGLPFPTLSTAYAGLYLGYGPVFYRSWTVPGQPQLQLVNGTNSVILTNAQLSGASGHFHGIYFTD